jgi:hypothetical protein
MKTSYVYVLINKLNGEIIYVGEGTGRRIHHHLRFVENNEKPNRRINPHLFYKCKEILRSGGEIIEKKIFENLTKGEALDLEEELIKRVGIDNLCNFSLRGSLTVPPEGSEKREEYSIKMSSASRERWENKIYRENMLIKRKEQGKKMSGENHPMFGQTHTDDTRVKISESRKGKRSSQESIEKTRRKLMGREITWKDKIRESNKKTWARKKEEGYSVSQEARDKISLSSKGKIDKTIDKPIVSRIVELYQNFGPNRIRKQLLVEGYDVSLYIIRRELQSAGIYKKYRKNSKLE